MIDYSINVIINICYTIKAKFFYLLYKKVQGKKKETCVFRLPISNVIFK